MYPVLDNIFILTLIKLEIQLLLILRWLKGGVIDTLRAPWISFTCSVSQLFYVLLLTACTCDLQRLAFGHPSLLAHLEEPEGRGI